MELYGILIGLIVFVFMYGISMFNYLKRNEFSMDAFITDQIRDGFRGITFLLLVIAFPNCIRWIAPEKFD